VVTLPGGLDPLVVVFGTLGAVWGVVADRISARWPAHEDGSVRKVDWRTVVVVAFGVFVLAMVPVRFAGAEERALFGVYFTALVLLMGTDLDQRLLPDVVTLPLILLGFAVLAWGGDSLVSRQAVWLPIVGAILVPGILLAASLPFGAGAFGGGDVKLLVSVGLLAGFARIILAAFVGVMLGGIGVAALLVARRVTLKSHVPYGPFLIAGAVWAMLLPAST
jgi:prepilin signal peptidase PulO-like enzyme (type II secretory pathway)